MPDQNPDAEAALHKLGQQLREAYAKKHPTPQQSIDAAKDVVREQYEKEQEAERQKQPPPDATKDHERKPEEPDREG